MWKQCVAYSTLARSLIMRHPGALRHFATKSGDSMGRFAQEGCHWARARAKKRVVIGRVRMHGWLAWLAWLRLNKLKANWYEKLGVQKNSCCSMPVTEILVWLFYFLIHVRLP